MEVSISCCKILVCRMDSVVSDIHQGSTAFDKESKIKVLFKNGTLERLRKMIERQTNVFTLLLTACDW